MSEFTCAECGGTFERETPIEEAREELLNLFGTTPEQEDCVEICDPCWNKLGLNRLARA